MSFQSLLEQSLLFSLKYDLPAGFMRRTRRDEDQWREAYYYEMVKLKYFNIREVAEFCNKDRSTVWKGIQRHIKRLAEIGDSYDSTDTIPREQRSPTNVPPTLH